MSATSIPAVRLTQLREQGHAEAATSRFVDPTACSKAMRAIRRRGETWAQAIVGHPFERRSTAFPDLPWLRSGEEQVIALADAEEDRAQFDAIVEGI